MVERIYLVTKSFPKEEQFGLVSQMRRAAVSIPSNIAETAARKGNKDFIQFLYIALGSLSELETQIIMAQRLNFNNNEDMLESTSTIGKKLVNLIKHSCHPTYSPLEKGARGIDVHNEIVEK